MSSRNKSLSEATKLAFGEPDRKASNKPTKYTGTPTTISKSNGVDNNNPDEQAPHTEGGKYPEPLAKFKNFSMGFASWAIVAIGVAFLGFVGMKFLDFTERITRSEQQVIDHERRIEKFEEKEAVSPEMFKNVSDDLKKLRDALLKINIDP
jgi:hypothetical protein